MYCTCTVSSSNSVYHISGAGIYANRAARPVKSRPLDNNELIPSAGDGLAVTFLSNSSRSGVGVGMITLPDEHTVYYVSSRNTTGVWTIFNPGGRPGELRIATPSPIPPTSQGIYTATIPDSNNNMFIFNVGLYPPGFNGKLLLLVILNCLSLSLQQCLPPFPT